MLNGRNAILAIFLYALVLLLATSKRTIQVKTRSIKATKSEQIGKDPVIRFPTDSCQMTHLVIPLRNSQIERAETSISRWSEVPPCRPSETRGLALVFFIASNINDASSLNKIIDDRILSAFEKLDKDVKFCFKGVSIERMILKQADDTHETISKLMFEKALSGNITLNVQSLFYMEPDVVPLKLGWLSELIDETVYARKFWIRGASFWGNASLIENDSPSKRHRINGNALYCIGDKSLTDFYFGHMRPWIERKFGDSPSAYDTDFWEYIWDFDNYDFGRKVYSLYQYTDRIANMWHSQYKRSDIPNAAVAHGGTLIE